MTTAPFGSRHRVLVVANTTCAGSELFREIPERADETETDVLIVAPALTSRLRYWMSDEDAGTAAAHRRLTASIEQCQAAGVAVRGAPGDADPLAATDDAVRTFDPGEIIITAHPSVRSNWLEHLVVAHVVVAEPVDHRAPARERHATRDWVILGGAVVLFILSSALTVVFYATGAPGWLIATWFIVCDVGVKMLIVVALWMLVQRRPRIDRPNY